MSVAEVRRDPNRGPGYAEVRLPGAASAASNPAFRICWGASDYPNLGKRGWQSAEETLGPETAAAAGDDLILILGPDICDHLESNNYELILPGLGGEHYVLPWSEIPRRPEQGRETVFGRAIPPDPPKPAPRPPIAPKPEPDPEQTLITEPPGEAEKVEPAEPPPLPQPGDKQPIEEPRKRAPVVVLSGLLLVLLLLVSAGAWFGWQWWNARQPAAPVPFAACLGDGGVPIERQTARDIAGRAGCGAEDYPALAQAFQEHGRDNEALLLLEVGAEKGVVPAMAALARLYDPATFVAGKPFSEPNPREAAKYYQAAEKGGDTSVVTARTALRALLQQRADQGDDLSRLTIGDYWP